MSGPAPGGLKVPTKTILDQQRAARPDASAWVSANAGSGKTKVLADRVMRLLLAGTEPSRILCLTFTKAAAANMENRIFAELGKWVRLDDEALAAALEKLEGRRPDRARLARARRLFAHAVETPGGLKIETIHAFCERLLHMFPFEANVPARFTVLDDNESAVLLAEALSTVMARAALGRDPALRDALTLLAENHSDTAIAETIREALRHRAALLAYAREPAAFADAMAGLAAALGLDEGETPQTIARAMCEDGIAPAEWPAIAEVLRGGKKTDQTNAEALSQAAQADDPWERLAHYRSLFFTQKGTPAANRSVATGSVPPDLAERLFAERDRLAALDERMKGARTLERTQALLTLAQAVLARIEAVKRARGALDFDDLVERTLTLLERADAAWVLYKLDAGIDHLLVDEAQDTSPTQWAILKRLTEELFAGDGAVAKTRTLFAVGDPKQSIYGFQGAAPQEFEGSGRYFQTRARQADLLFEPVELTVSFRSAPAVLSAVDAVFAVETHYRGLSFADVAVGTAHESARPDAPGLVEVWETERPADREEPEAWVLPLDELAESAPAIRVAERIARTVERLTTHGDDTGQRFAPGDILILVRSRGAFFEAVIRALKRRGVPVAGADRLDVGQHIAVRDLVAAGRAALLPDDDLTLAAALKSPLVGLTDDDLMRIAARREDSESLADALGRVGTAGDAAAARAGEALGRWRNAAARRGPFAFYAGLIGPEGGREQLVARLGQEAGDAIDAFLAMALDFEHRHAPSLKAFLLSFESDGREVKREIKRDLDAGRDEVRVMTVHGAKGLEAPFVILADDCSQPNGRHDPKLFALPLQRSGHAGPATVPVWSPKRDEDAPAVARLREAVRTREAEEHNRLLYVAMTRAKDRLVVASYSNGKRGKDGNWPELPAMCWTGMIRRGLEGRLEEVEVDGLRVQRWQSGPLGAAAAAPPPAEDGAGIAMPDWLDRPAPAEPEAPPPLSPSSALAAADRPHRPGDGPFAADARLAGTLVHQLVEHLPGLPAAARPTAAERFVAVRAGRLDEAKRAGVVAQALALLDEPALAPLFGPDARAEVAVAGEIAVGSTRRAVSGQIDRLVVSDEAVVFADFKTSARPPADLAAVPEAHVAQLAVYGALLADIFPGRSLRALLVYTAGPRVLEVPGEALAAALDRIPVL
ncbi:MULTISPECIES: double-strand break repair helicase AddA [unclassified Chelatococcus]|uniref:double-strand break repair helicase AddA n=1 Tax=unclassified Chelatococcus TaxID=2638111 RepID=UPI0002EEC4FD|nr:MULTISPECIES: double-strand break repair helicase AddA [unclassified Chelatococcus]ALA17217.1 double-strand break repair protein AddA [Chelatococcus sp. CO-6]